MKSSGSEKALMLYDTFKGKKVKVHTEHLDTIEGTWEDHLVSHKPEEGSVVVWWVQIRNGSSIFFVLAEIVVEVIE
jgi:hypothetical protein